ncbi:hypothetical protein MHYP_G00288640 [Metynnis hypsauchen]
MPAERGINNEAMRLMLRSLPWTNGARENVALNGKATQSSLYGTGFPSRAIDGNRDGVYADGSCTHTQDDLSPWWRLDLLKKHKVSSVIIVNRADNVPNRLNGAEVRIGDSLDNNGNNNPRCAVISTIDKETPTMSFECNWMEGQYINIVIPQRKEYLTLCEVEVYGYPTQSGENVALNGKATQSSLYGTGFPSRAIDGNRDGVYADGSCTHTQDDLSPWWRLDLLKKHKVSSVIIVNRADNVPNRLNGAEVRIGDSLDNNGNNNPRCAVISTIDKETPTMSFECNWMEGQYINIVIPQRKEYLTLCEVEVYGYPTQSGENVALNGKATQSSLYGTGFPSRAIDGNRDGVYADGSCTHTQDDLSPWWRLDLLKKHKVASVIVVNRADSVPNRLNGAEIRIGDSLDNNGNNNPRCAVISTIGKETPTMSFECNWMEGQYINIVIPQRKEYLTLCEVEVYGYPTRSGENVALNGKATQSSLYGTGFPSRAIDGNRDGVYADGSCTHTQDDLSPWWRLDLLKKHKVSSVIIVNRADNVPNRLNGAEVRIGDSLDNNGNNNPRCAVISTIDKETPTMSFECNWMEGQYINIVIPQRKEYLTLCEVEVYGYPTQSGENVALNGKATQSSLYGTGFPSRAIDGNRDGVYADGSCTHTQDDLSPWWRLDLLKKHKVASVIVVNRADSVPNRLNGAEIRIGDSLDNNGNNNPRCAVISTIGKETPTMSFECNWMEGQYINIVIPQRKEYLTLCEVEVYGYPTRSGENVALNGKATQSSLYGTGFPSRAIDGNRDGVYADGSCTHTQDDLSPWWRLDLLKKHKVASVIVVNRADSVPNRLNGAEIRIGDSLDNNGNNNPRCAVISTIGKETPTMSFECNWMEGQYINIVIPQRKEYLTLCEVEVYGYPTQSGENVALNGKATQSSLYGTGFPSRAIDGNRDGVYADGSCTHTQDDLSPWWRLDLLKKHKVFSVTIVNRVDTVPHRLNGAEIRIGDSLDNNGNNNPRCAVISTIDKETPTMSFECNGMEGQYINIVIPQRKEYLTLCEVEVYGYPTQSGENVALNGKATQSSLYGTGFPSTAIDGNRDGVYADGSCTHTQDDLSPWWRLDLLKKHKVFSITVVNRVDTVPHRLNGAEIRIGDSLDNNGNNNPRCAVISTIDKETPTMSFECNGMEGQYINIVIPQRKEYLTLCEVEVYGAPLI